MRDLAIGDIVAYDGHLLEVESVSRERCTLKGDSLVYEASPNEIDGVPLTGKILQKNFFQKDDENGRYWRLIGSGKKLWLLAIGITDYTDDIEFLVSVHDLVDRVTIGTIFYVHELQHLLGVLGEYDDLRLWTWKD